MGLGLASPLQEEVAALRALEEDHEREARALASELARQRAREAQIVAETAQTSATWEEAVARQDSRIRDLEQELQRRAEEAGRLEGAARVREDALSHERALNRGLLAESDGLRAELAEVRAVTRDRGGSSASTARPSAARGRETELEAEAANLRREVERLQNDPKDRERLRTIDALQQQVQRLRGKLEHKAISSQKYKDAVRALKVRLAGAEAAVAEGELLEAERQRSAELSRKLQAGADLFEQRFKTFAEAKEADIEAAQRDRESAITAADKALEANRQLQGQLAEQVQRVASLEKELEAGTADVAEQRKRAGELEKRLEERAEDLRQAVADNIELTRERQALNKALRERPAADGSAAEGLEATRKELCREQEERRALAVQLADREARAAAAERTSEEASAQCHELIRERKDLRAALESLREELAAARAAQVESARVEGLAALDARERELAAREVAESAREVTAAEMADLRAEKRAQFFRAEQLENARTALQADLSARDREAERLRVEVGQVESRQKHSETAAQAAEQARHELEEQCVGLTRRAAQLEGELEAKAAEAARERAAWERLEEEKRHLIEDGLEKGELITKLYQLVRKSQDLHRADTRSLEAELGKRESALEEARRRFNGLQAVLTRLDHSGGGGVTAASAGSLAA